MENISPLLQKRIDSSNSNKTDICQKNTKTEANNTKIEPLKQDTIEFKNNKNEKLKKALMIGAGIGLAGAVIISAIKARNSSKIKKELTAMYDEIFENLNKELSGTINFEKPELVFKRLDKKVGRYNINKNKIELDPRRIKRVIVPKDLSKCFSRKISDNLIIYVKSQDGNIIDILRKNLGKDYRIATKEEALAIIGSTMEHELTHAKQFQMLLSCEGGKEKYIEYLKKKIPNFSIEQFPFIKNYKPKKVFPLGQKIKVEVPGKKLSYKMEVILNGFTNYIHGGSSKYYTNPTEIEARLAEYGYFKDLKNGKYKHSPKISDEFLEYLIKATKRNYESIINAIEKK